VALQNILQGQNLQISRNQVANLISTGLVTVNGKIITKPSFLVLDTDLIAYQISEPKYVSRAGLKLEQALANFQIDVNGKIVLDAGLSTGGFTDCLLQNGAQKVYGVDVGTNQVHPKIAANLRVHVMEQTNLRYLERLPELVDLITLDLSFISLLKIVPNLPKLLKPAGSLITLIKPQFEVGPGKVDSNGILKDDQLREQVVQDVILQITKLGFNFEKLMTSPITGSDGNIEFLAYFKLA
jgi:23S rRNA (cytidine1920-2'-O)/16S rRNA (cytidine1409-2'-O)-methyltransferase